jgi:general secretion pathway protein G
MIVVIIIIGVLATLIGPRLIGRVGQSKQSVATANAASVATAVRTFLADGNKIPDGSSLDFLIRKPGEGSGADSWRGPYLDNADALKDPWGRTFTIKAPGEKNFDFDIISFGADGKPGGEGEDADVIKP